jgi:hypothetical protein
LLVAGLCSDRAWGQGEPCLPGDLEGQIATVIANVFLPIVE